MEIKTDTYYTFAHESHLDVKRDTAGDFILRNNYTGSCVFLGSIANLKKVISFLNEVLEANENKT